MNGRPGHALQRSAAYRVAAIAESGKVTRLPTMMPISNDQMSRLFKLRLELIDESAILQLRFSKNGYVAATVGVKNSHVCAPLLPWSLSKDGCLVVLWEEREPLLEWSGIEFGDTVVTVETPVGQKLYAQEVIPDIEIRTTLPRMDVEQILAAVRKHTDEPIMLVMDGEFGPEVRTGRRYGYVWKVRRAPSGWRVMSKHEWAS
jgi:hypothetical protein